jgi:DNA transformation protein
VSDAYRDFILDQLSALGAVRCRAMFGGHGLYLGPVFFGILHRGRLYLRAIPRSEEAAGAPRPRPFHPRPGLTIRSYHEVPAEILEDPERLGALAREAVAAGRAARRPAGGRAGRAGRRGR